MNVQFDSLQALLMMEGHGPFVWAAYLITLAVMFYLGFSPLVRRKRFMAELWRQQQLRTEAESTDTGRQP